MNFTKQLTVFLIVGFCAFAFSTHAQESFSSTDKAVKTLLHAAKTKDQAELTEIFGPDREKLLSGDPVEDKNALDHFAGELEKSVNLERVNSSKFVLKIGENNWPFPIPLVKEDDKWHFDTKAGLEEILNRRIGRNELSTIASCRAYVLAQWEYFTEAPDTSKDGLAVFAQKFISTPGRKDGLYWDTAEGGITSPLGSLMAQAHAEGYGKNRPALDKNGHPITPPKLTPYHGYYYRILTAQGRHAPGGEFSYVINGNMIAGYALIAYPDKWGSSGIMTFIVNQQGRLYEKNLGPQTAEIAQHITRYDPDSSWRLVREP